MTAVLAAAISLAASAQTIQDIYSDTWVGIFYVTWHTAGAHNGKPFTADVTKVLAEDDNARFDGKNPAWKDSSLHWGEPEYGYFLSRDEYVIRHDFSMLTDAGVDVLIFDVTNACFYWEEWDAIGTLKASVLPFMMSAKMCAVEFLDGYRAHLRL